MPRPSGRFTYDARLQRFRDGSGQLVRDDAILPTAIALTVSSDDALEMRHTVTTTLAGNTQTTEHVAGAATPEWIKQMRKGLMQPCMTCGASVGLKDVALSGTPTRDWGESQ